MKLKINQNVLQNITRFGLFLCVIAIIVQLYPHENKFKYQFEIGKPWSYELITASFDFPIYKNEREITAEKDELLKSYTPYYQLDTTQALIQFKKLTGDYAKMNGTALLFQDFILEKLKNIYARGIISSEKLS